jgi:DNA-binding response OmpR family regulator
MKKILIIEDEPDVAESIKLFLENEGYAAEFTLDPKEGVEKLKWFDLLLLDLIMPRMSGREVLKEMKKRKIKIPVIVLSAVGLPMTVGEELRREYPGIVFIPKTELYNQLIPAIKSVLK